MLDLKQRFRALDAMPVPDLERVIDRRARHLASVPGALGPIETRGMSRGRFLLRGSELLLAAAIVVLAIGLAVFVHLARTEAPARHRPSPPPSTSLSEVCPQAGDCALAAGTYSIDRLGPTLTFAVPGGWRVRFAYGPGEDLHFDRDGTLRIWVGADPVAGWYEGCSGPIDARRFGDPGAGRTATTLSRWMSRHPQLATTAMRRVDLGGLEGVMVDSLASPISKTGCSALAIPDWGYPMHQWGVLQGERARTYFLDVPPTGERPARTIVVGIKAQLGQFDAAVREVEPILASFVFS